MRESMWSITAPCSTCGLNRIDLRVLDDADAVSGWPVEQVAPHAPLVGAVCVRDDDVPCEHVPPVGRVAGIAVESLEQRSDVGAGTEREVLRSER